MEAKLLVGRLHRHHHQSHIIIPAAGEGGRSVTWQHQCLGRCLRILINSPFSAPPPILSLPPCIDSLLFFLLSSFHPFISFILLSRLLFLISHFFCIQEHLRSSFLSTVPNILFPPIPPPSSSFISPALLEAASFSFAYLFSLLSSPIAEMTRYGCCR